MEDLDGKTLLRLPAILDLAAAADLRDALLEVLSGDGGGDLVVDGAGVERMSTAAVQVLLAAAAGAGAAGRSFAVAAPSARLSEAFRQLGLAAELEAFV